MPLRPISEMMVSARRNHYAVGYFESWDVASLQGVIDAAEAENSPIIIGFNGELLSRSGRLAAERLSWHEALGKAAATSAAVPCGFIFNECSRDDWVRRAVTSGFNLVMPADPDANLQDYTERMAELTRYAHQHNVAVEAEIGELPYGGSGQVEPGGSSTDPEAAAEFVDRTDIDLLAVSVGNVHLLIRGQRALDLDRLGAIGNQVPVPLVLHGGTGIEENTLREAIAMGVTKVSYGTILRQHYLAAIRTALNTSEINTSDENPNLLLGYGGNHDVLTAGRIAVREVVTEKLKSSQKALGDG